MKPPAAIEALEVLKSEALDPLSLRRSAGAAASWKSRLRAVIARSLGEGHDLVTKLDKNRYSLSAYSSSTPDSAFASAFAAGVQRATGYIDAAIFELGILSADDEPIDDRAFDADLWSHVQNLVDDEDWGKVASQTVILVEDTLRTWAGLDGNDYGKSLYAKALADNAELRLGQRSGEWEGWRMLGMGFAQAIGNVDRHRIQSRADAKKYAIGVLGLGSLLLTQLRFEHAELIPTTEAAE
jgi:hypothetical protein